MRISPAMLQRMEAWEGLVLHSYPDPLTGGAPWTIGYGHTGPDVHPGQTCTQQQAAEWFANDVWAAERFVTGKISMATQDQFDAMASFTFNAGVGNFLKSTILRQHNAGNYQAAGDGFLLWNPNNAVLQARRRTERGIYLTSHVDDVRIAAVKKFQVDHGLVDDGIVGPKTLAAGWKD